MHRGGEGPGTWLAGDDGEASRSGQAARDLDEHGAARERRARRDDEDERQRRGRRGDALGGVEDRRAGIEVDDRALLIVPAIRAIRGAQV